MSYMDYAPEWWYVIDDKRNLEFALLVVFLDSFPMSTLFFLAGYFAPPSFRKRGASLFIRDKFMHIGIPWIMGVILVAPFFAYASFLKFGLEAPSISDFITKWFFGPFYQQGHYWFLGILFAFLAAYAAVARRAAASGRGRKKSGAALPITALWISSVVFYYLGSLYIKPAVEWLNIAYVLYFQHARLVGYLGMFALGAYGWESGWFTPDGWSPSLAFWGLACAVSSILLLHWKFFLAPALSQGTNLWMDSLLYNTVMISATFLLIGVFARARGPQSNAAGVLSPHSYAIYWLHQIVLMPSIYFLKPYDIDISIKWVAVNLFTLSACFMLSRCLLKRAPLLKRIF
jgi:hypothetical protein